MLEVIVFEELACRSSTFRDEHTGLRGFLHACTASLRFSSSHSFVLAIMESYPLPHAGQTVHIAVWSVRNAAQLRHRLVAASQLPADEEGERERAAVDFAFVDAKMVSTSPVRLRRAEKPG